MIDLRLAVTDQVVGDYPVKVKCREHNDKTASMGVYADHLHCFGCGFHLSFEAPMLVNPLGYLLGISDDEVEKVSSRYTNESIDRYREKAAQESRMDPLPRTLAIIYNKMLNGPLRVHRKQWFYDRGLTDRTINDEDVLLGHDGTRFVIPVFDRNRNLVSLRYRMDPEYCTEQELHKHKYIGHEGQERPVHLPGAAPGQRWFVARRVDGHQGVHLRRGAGRSQALAGRQAGCLGHQRSWSSREAAGTAQGAVPDSSRISASQRTRTSLEKKPPTAP